MSLAYVPVELLRLILVFALDDHPAPSNVLRVSRVFHELGQPVLHARLRFHSIQQLIRFSEDISPLACAPKSLSVSLAGGTADFEVFKHLAAALGRCRRTLVRMRSDRARGRAGHENGPPERAEGEITQVPLELLSLRLHSHTNNPHLGYVYEALSLANPKTFVWMGPDPEHHFSTAIVPSATYHLLRALQTWTAVEHITLTNLAFPSDALGRNTPFAHDAPLLPPLPALRTLLVGQATLLPPAAVAALLARPGMDALERVRLVDAYAQSIWGPRVRRRDVEAAARALQGLSDEQREALVERVRNIVRCEKKTGRLAGGDDEDAKGVLD
ncbi:hypothetical protein C8Q77DRAFT_1055648 [Trametes polyzona]|nr:hypothetical protein C8Q77DRAFT_1055648 [Trametes polyzona]